MNHKKWVVVIGIGSYRIDPDTSSCVGGRCGSVCLRFSD